MGEAIDVAIYNESGGELKKLSESVMNEDQYNAVFICDDEEGWNVTHYSVTIPGLRPAILIPILNPIPLGLGRTVQVIQPKSINVS